MAKKPAAAKPYIDTDSDDSFMDLPEPSYRDRSPKQSSEAIDRLLDPAARRAGKLGALPKLPAPVDH